MYIYSCRKNHTDADHIGETTIKCAGRTIDREALASGLAPKSSVLVLVHGYNTDYDEVMSGYNTIVRGYGALYDRIIGFIWPGGDNFYDWKVAESFTPRAASYLDAP